MSRVLFVLALAACQSQPATPDAAPGCFAHHGGVCIERDAGVDAARDATVATDTPVTDPRIDAAP